MDYIIVLDLETTGLDVTKDTIIEVACIKFDAQTFEEKEVFHTFINPQREIPELISQITQITLQEVKDAPVFSQIREELQEFIGDFPILGHNTNFDKNFLISHGTSLENNLTLDTFYLANFLLWDIKSLNLEYICSHLGVELEWAHRAINDARATLQVYRILIEKLQHLSFLKKTIFSYVTGYSSSKVWNYFWEKYKIWEKVSEESFFQVFFSSLPKEQRDEEETFYENKQSIEDIFTSFPHFEIRPNQQEMSLAVQKNLREWGKVLIEAPTGVGKTFAYLIPAILHSKELKEQVFISTSTKALQDQICTNDLPFLKQQFPFSFRYSKLKGKRNYLWIFHFFEYFSSEQSHTIEKTSFFLKILFCLEKNPHGELDILDYYGEEYNFLNHIHASSAFSLSAENPYIEYEYIVKARRDAQESDIVIINNHILFQDILSEGRILWTVQNLVIDEAHNLEDVVTQALKKKLYIASLMEVFLTFERAFYKHKEFDISFFLLKKEEFMFEVHSLLDISSAYLFSQVGTQTQYKTALVREEFFWQFPHVFPLLEKIQVLWKEIMTSIWKAPEKTQQVLSWEISFFQDIWGLFEVLATEERRKKHIFIVQHSDLWGIQLEYTILSPASFLQENLWTKLDSVLLTSATLRIGESYDYVTNMYHLFDFEFLTLDTDFDYKKQALLVIPNDLWNIKNNFWHILSFLKTFFILVRGQTMVLFTSFQSIRDTYTGVSQILKQQWITLLAQWVSGSKQKQIDYFKKHSQSSILLWTDSFWEGIDIPGDDLKYLIIHKIPFMVPTDPIFQARSTLFKDSFQEYSIPKAILKLKQWFGRLIRSKTDSGIVIFLDSRISSSDWGKEFFKSFPEEIHIKHCSSDKLFEILTK